MPDFFFCCCCCVSVAIVILGTSTSNSSSTPKYQFRSPLSHRRITHNNSHVTMAKSSRSSTRKANNQRLKANVFGPVESARAERLSAKLLEIAAQPKPSHDGDDMKVVEDVDAAAAVEGEDDDKAKDAEGKAASSRSK